MKKKILSIMLCVAMSAGLLAGCGGDGGAQNEQQAAGSTEEAGAVENGNAEQAQEAGDAEASADSEQDAGEKTVEDVYTPYTGILTFLNFDETSFGRWSAIFNYLGTSLVKDGYVESEMLNPDMMSPEPDPEAYADMVYPVKYYDTLDSMIMGLISGEIVSFDIYSCVAKYICSHNDEIVSYVTYNTEKERTPYAEAVFDRFENGFSFMMTEENTALRDEFNTVIEELKSDGTLDELIKTHIDDVANGGEPVPIELQHDDSWDTIRVAVTGCLPPMDFVAADGSFAGFNTALLAEIGKRLNKNIELTQVDCASRSTALASGTVDVVFWVRGDKEGSKYANMTDAEYQAYIEERNSQLTEDEVKALEVLDSITSRKDDYTKDMPDGTVITEPYYVDIPVGVMTRAAYDATLEMINQAGAEG